MTRFSQSRRTLGLSYDLARRDLVSSYARSQLGLAWLLLAPLGMLAIYGTVFSLVLGVEWRDPAGGANLGFALPFFCGLLPYLAFADLLGAATMQFPSKRALVAKAAFPLAAIPLATWLRACAVAAPGLAILLGFGALHGALLSWGALWLAPALALLVLALLGTALLFATLGAFFGDLQHLLQLLQRVLFYAAPITYPWAMVPPRLREPMLLNPLTGYVEWIRGAACFGHGPSGEVALATVGWTAGLLFAGAWLFARVRGVVADAL